MVSNYIRLFPSVRHYLVSHDVSSVSFESRVLPKRVDFFYSFLDNSSFNVGIFKHLKYASMQAELL